MGRRSLLRLQGASSVGVFHGCSPQCSDTVFMSLAVGVQLLLASARECTVGPAAPRSGSGASKPAVSARDHLPESASTSPPTQRVKVFSLSFATPTFNSSKSFGGNVADPASGA